MVDDHRVMAEGLAAVLSAQGWRVNVLTGDAVSDLPAILRLVDLADSPVVLLDLQLGRGVDGLDYIEPLAALGAAVIVVSGFAGDIDAARCLERGAACVLRKSLTVGDLVATVKRAARGAPLVPAEERGRLLAALARHREEERRRFAGFRRLTRQERSTLAAIIAGHSAQEVARTRMVSVATVRTQIASVRKKLGVPTQLAAVSLALQAGWQPDHEPPNEFDMFGDDRRAIR
ncbi:MAG: response regulator [Acidimicrobiales bacterium]